MRTYVDFRSLTTSDQVVSSIKDSKWLLFHQNQKEFYIRLCIDCSRLLNKKHQSMKDKSIKPKIFSLYDVISVLFLKLFLLFSQS